MKCEIIKLREEEFLLYKNSKNKLPLNIKYSNIDNINIKEDITEFLVGEETYTIKGDITKSSIWEEFKKKYLSESLVS